jgi:hypothetical protein
MMVLVCTISYRLNLQTFAYLQVIVLLFGDIGCYSIKPAFIIPPVPSTIVSPETVYESIALVSRVITVFAWVFKNY